MVYQWRSDGIGLGLGERLVSTPCWVVAIDGFLAGTEGMVTILWTEAILF